jgi:Asp-tRNA(Asn)/Glu-tRNA(Gln) amidotransferase B subunit
LWAYSKFTKIDQELKDFIDKNKKTITENAKQENADFLYDYCDGEVSIEY